MEYKIALIPGDGIGPEIVGEARKVLDAVCTKFGHTFTYSEVLLGGASIDVHGVPLTEEAVETAKASKGTESFCQSPSGLSLSGTEGCMSFEGGDHRRRL